MGGGGGGGGTSETHVELSSAVPWVEGRGWLEAAGALQYIWMDGLTEGDAYVAEIRVGGWSINQQSPGTFHIGASDASHADIHQTGASQTLAVFIPAVEGSLSLITIETQGLGGWLLDDVRVLHLGKIG